jgi:predicted MFS family arabinose efflux permease
MWKEFVISAVLPLAGVALGVYWKDRLKDKLSTEDRLVILELLIATLSLTIAIWANDNDARSPKTRDVAAVATILIGIALVPWVGYLVKNAYDPNHQPPFTEEEAWWANACGGWVFAVTYFFTHV